MTPVLAPELNTSDPGDEVVAGSIHTHHRRAAVLRNGGRGSHCIDPYVRRAT